MVVTEEVGKVFENIDNFITVPSEQIGSVSLDEIVKGYFNDSIGLGESFYEVVQDTYGPLSSTTGNVYLSVYKKTTDLCEPDEPKDQTEGYKLTLNTCTLIVQGPPTQIYFKISIVGGNQYKFVEANNAQCTALDPVIDEDLFPFGICNERSKTPPAQPSDEPTRAPTDSSTKKFGDIINDVKTAAYSVYLSDLEPDTYKNDFFDCTKNNELAACRVAEDTFVYLSTYDDTACGQDADDPSISLKLRLNECTKFSSDYIKVSIIGQEYELIKADNADCEPTEDNTDRIRFGTCNEGALLTTDDEYILLDDSSPPHYDLLWDCTKLEDKRGFNFVCISPP